MRIIETRRYFLSKMCLSWMAWFLPHNHRAFRELEITTHLAALRQKVRYAGFNKII